MHYYALLFCPCSCCSHCLDILLSSSHSFGKALLRRHFLKWNCLWLKPLLFKLWYFMVPGRVCSAIQMPSEKYSEMDKWLWIHGGREGIETAASLIPSPEYFQFFSSPCDRIVFPYLGCKWVYSLFGHVTSVGQWNVSRSDTRPLLNSQCMIYWAPHLPYFDLPSSRWWVLHWPGSSRAMMNGAPSQCTMDV